MKTIQEKSISEIVIKKSKFISILYPMHHIEEAKKILEDVKQEYKGATHYCYAYKLRAIEKCSDDGEPAKTAGVPMLNVLKNENLDFIFCVIIRYFGGIKLGASGLIHAYQDSVKEAIKNSTMIEVIQGFFIQITFSYDNIKKTDHLLKKYSVLKKEFHENVTYSFEITETEWNLLQKKLDYASIDSIEEKMIKQMY